MSFLFIAFILWMTTLQHAGQPMFTCFISTLQAGEGRGEARTILWVGAQASHCVLQLRVRHLQRPVHGEFPCCSLHGTGKTSLLMKSRTRQSCNKQRTLISRRDDHCECLYLGPCVFWWSASVTEDRTFTYVCFTTTVTQLRLQQSSFELIQDVWQSQQKQNMRSISKAIQQIQDVYRHCRSTLVWNSSAGLRDRKYKEKSMYIKDKNYNIV